MRMLSYNYWEMNESKMSFLRTLILHNEVDIALVFNMNIITT